MKKDKKIYLTDPSCGGGGMIIAAAVNLKEQGIDYQRVLDVTVRDLDWNSVYMCYVQLSLLGIRARVIQGNALDGSDSDCYVKERIFETPKRMGVVI